MAHKQVLPGPLSTDSTVCIPCVCSQLKPKVCWRKALGEEISQWTFPSLLPPGPTIVSAL